MANQRNVKFEEDEKLCTYHDGAVLDVVDSCRKEIWYQHADLAHVKRKAMVVSKEAHRYGFGSLLTNTYGNSCDETQEALKTWSRNANSRRGLERWINDEYSAKRSDIRRRTIQSVLRAQEKMRQENINDVEYGMKVISRLSEAFSQDSRNFARAMGIADEYAAQESMDNETAPAVKQNTDTVCKLPTRSTSPRSVVNTSRPLPPRKNLGLSGTSDLRNFL